MQNNFLKNVLRERYLNWLGNFWPFFLIIGLVLVFFYPVFFKGLLPIPADITTGLYFPWLDYKWGFPTGVPVKNPLPSDIVSLVFPWRTIVIESLKGWRLPLWNAQSFSGMPLLANFQSGVFSVSNIFHLFLSFNIAWSLGVVVQPLLALIFTFLFLRHLQLSKLASLLGAVTFSFSAFSIIWLEYNVHGHALYWLPFLLLSTDKIIREQRKNWVFLLSGGIALQIFSGYPQIVLYSLFITGIFGVYRWFDVAKKGFGLLFIWAAGIALGVLIAAPVILPGFEALKLSVRSIDPVAAADSARFLPWQNLVTAIAPDFFGNPATYNFWGVSYYDNFAFYVGIVPLFLALSTIGKKGLSVFFQIVVFIGLLIALPNPVARAVAESSIFGVGSIAARSLFMFSFGIAVLAGIGLDSVLKHTKKAFFFSLIFAFLITVIWMLVLGKFSSSVFGHLADANLQILRRNLLLPTFLIGVLFVTIVFFNIFRGRMKFLLPIILVGLSILDLFRFGWKYLPFSQEKLVFPETPVIEFLQKQKRPFRVEFGEAIPENMWIPYGLESAAGYDAMAPLRYSQFLGALNSGKPTNPYGRVAKINNYESPLFDTLNVKYILAVKYDKDGIRGPNGLPKQIFSLPKLDLAYEDKTVRVYENTKAYPRAFLAGNVVIKQNEQDIISTLADAKFDGLHSVVLEKGVNKSPSGQINGRVNFNGYANGKIELSTEADKPGVLVLLNNYYPGWKAYVDGKETEIYRADFTFQAVEVPGGDHIVKFIYDPESFKIGKWMSMATAVFLVALILYERISTKGSRPTQKRFS